MRPIGDIRCPDLLVRERPVGPANKQPNEVARNLPALAAKAEAGLTVAAVAVTDLREGRDGKP